jgi:hypothetical protein
MSFRNIAAFVDTEESGQIKELSFRKVPAVVTGAGTWYDYSMAPGNPAPQYYAAAPLTAQTMARSTDGGLQHGGNVSPEKKYLRKVTAMVVAAAGVPQRLYMLDYLMFYPFVDMGTSDSQSMTNTQTLTRYTDGDGVRIMAILVAPHGLVGDSFFVTYTNQDGTAGRTTPLHTMSTAISVNGTILTTQQTGAGRFGPFLTLQTGDTGVRSIEAVQCTAGTDVGLFTLVLVQPLAELTVRGIDAPTEKDFYLDSGGKIPQIIDDAYLNFISCPNGSLTGVPLFGMTSFIWTS